MSTSHQLDKVIDVLTNAIPDVHASFDSINHGGCGEMACIIAEHLDCLGVEYNLVGTGYRPHSLSNAEVNHIIDECDIDSIPNEHILVKIGEKYFDSEGDKSDSHYVHSVIAEMDHPTVKRMLEVDCWNPWFDRSQVDGMRQHTRTIFEALFGEETFKGLDVKEGCKEDTFTNPIHNYSQLVMEF